MAKVFAGTEDGASFEFFLTVGSKGLVVRCVSDGIATDDEHEGAG